MSTLRPLYSDPSTGPVEGPRKGVMPALPCDVARTYLVTPKKFRASKIGQILRKFLLQRIINTDAFCGADPNYTRPVNVYAIHTVVGQRTFPGRIMPVIEEFLRGGMKKIQAIILTADPDMLVLVFGKRKRIVTRK